MTLKNTLLGLSPSLYRIKISNISMHPAVSHDIKLIVGSTQFRAQTSDLFSKEGAQLFLQRFPPEILLSPNQEGACFAGLRSFQIAKICLAPSTEILTIAHQKLSLEEIENIAQLDPYLTALGFCVDSKNWDIDFVRKWKNVSKKVRQIVTPNIQTKKALSGLLGISSRRIFSARQQPQKRLLNSQKK